MRGSRFATWQEAEEAGRFLRSGGDERATAIGHAARSKRR